MTVFDGQQWRDNHIIVAAVTIPPMRNNDSVITNISGGTTNIIGPKWALLATTPSSTALLDITVSVGANNQSNLSLLTNPSSVTLYGPDDRPGLTIRENGAIPLLSARSGEQRQQRQYGYHRHFATAGNVITGNNTARRNRAAGNDTINALGGNDTINGGAGNDTISGGSGNDTVNGMRATHSSERQCCRSDGWSRCGPRRQEGGLGDTFVINGNASSGKSTGSTPAQAFDDVPGNNRNAINAATEIIVTRNGTTMHRLSRNSEDRGNSHQRRRTSG